MNESDLTALLKPQDQRVIQDTAQINWVPKNPRELLLPYMSKNDKEVDRTSLEFRRQKAKEVYDGYEKIITSCKEIEDTIEAQCKNVIITLDPKKHLRVIESVRRVFGTDGTKITFEMYKACIAALAEQSKQNIPKPTL